MFTVKHIGPDGKEFALECASYAIEPLVPVRTSNEKRFRLLTFDTPYQQDEYSMLWVGRRCANWPGAHALHIMNRFGSTVASHFFELDGDPLYGEVISGETPVDKAA